MDGQSGLKMSHPKRNPVTLVAQRGCPDFVVGADRPSADVCLSADLLGDCREANGIALLAGKGTLMNGFIFLSDPRKLLVRQDHTSAGTARVVGQLLVEFAETCVAV